jgi:transcriptional regulator with XRE-family HTH domain
VPDAERDAAAYVKRLRWRRRDLGLTLKQLADRVGIAYTVLSRIENGKRRLTLAEAFTLADALDMPRPDIDPRGDLVAARATIAALRDHIARATAVLTAVTPAPEQAGRPGGLIAAAAPTDRPHVERGTP